MAPPIERPDKEFWILPFDVPIFSIYQRLLLKYFMKLNNSRNDVVVNSFGTFQPTFVEDVIYAHGVTAWSFDEEYISKMRRIYAFPYMLLSEKKNVKLDGAVTVVANSKYTAHQLKQVGVDVDAVVYPPVASHVYLPLSRQQKFDNVVVFGRLAHAKKMDFVAELAKQSATTKFVVVCSVSKGYLPLLKSLLWKCRTLKNVEFHYNVGYGEVLSLLAKSKIVLNMGLETFGYALAEAVSAGCIPVVHPEGGALEVVEGIEHYEASNVAEATEAIDCALSTWKPEKARHVADVMRCRFGFERFAKQFIPYLNGT